MNAAVYQFRPRSEVPDYCACGHAIGSHGHPYPHRPTTCVGVYPWKCRCRKVRWPTRWTELCLTLRALVRAARMAVRAAQDELRHWRKNR